MQATQTKNNFMQHFWLALALGLGFRLISSYFVFGPQALDDYLNQLIPAYKFSETGVHELPAWRSPLVIWALGGLLELGKWIGISKPVAQAQFLAAMVGVFSLTSLWGCLLFFQAVKKPEIGKIALYATALHGLMPFVSTRFFLESLSMGPLSLGVGFLIWSVLQNRRMGLILGLVFLGLATLIRFQVGMLYLATLIWLLCSHRKWWKEAFLVSFALAIINAGIDWLDHRPIFSTLIAYIETNKHIADYGSEPWYATWVTWLAVGFFPFSLLLLKQWRRLTQPGLRELLGLALIFVVVHSLVPHKEERFMYPIFPISIWLWSALWFYSKNLASSRNFVRPVILTLNLVLLIAGCFFNTQLGEIGVPAKMSSLSSRVLYLDRDSLVGAGFMSEYFIRTNSKLVKADGSPTLEKIKDLLKSNSYEVLAVMTSNPELLPELKLLQNSSTDFLQCSQVQEESSFIDSLLYKMNPKRNQRRRTTWFVACSEKTWFNSHFVEN